MPKDITQIPQEELIADLTDTCSDIATCVIALSVGLETYSDGKSVQKRLDSNQAIRKLIEAELSRRERESAGVV